MRLIVSVVGRSESGKTTLLESLIPELKKRGYKVMAIKHASHDFQLEEEGKDSWRLAQAGSEVVGISSPRKMAFVKPTEHDLSPQEISRVILWDYDIILAEGFKEAATYKVEIHTRGEKDGLLSPKEQLLAVVADEPLDVDLAQCSPTEIGKLADIIEKHLKAQQKEEDIDLFINETYVPLNPFVRKWLISILLAMVSNLQGVGDVKSLNISLRRKI